MSFDTEVVKPDRGRAIRVDISLDGFSTIAYRYSDVAGALDGTNEYDPRVLSPGGLGPVRRAFGQNRIAASSNTSLKLANADGSVDWICGSANIADAAKARFRIYVVLYDPSASPLSFTAKMLGEFVLSSWPQRTNTEVVLNLADDFMGRLGAGLLLPTLLDWQNVGTTANNPIRNSIGLPASISVNTPLPLAFGEDMLLGFPTIIPWGNNGNGETYEERVIVPLYCTLDSTAVSQDLVQQLIVEHYSFNENQPGTQFLTINREFYPPEWVAAGVTAASTWTVEKSPAISKGGLNFYVVYLVVREDLGIFKFQNIQKWLDASTDDDDTANLALMSWLQTFAYANGYPPEAVDSTTKYRWVASRVTKWYAKVSPGSQRTNPPASNFIGIAHAVDVVTDLVSVYSAATVDSTSAARVKAGSPYAACSGVVQPWTERANNPSFPPPPLSLRGVLTKLAQSSDFDIFVNWSGQIAFSSDVTDYTTATQAGGLVEIFEEDLKGFQQWIPSDGERHSPFNRVYLKGGKPNPTTYEDVPFQGPFDVDDADIPLTARSIEVELEQGWRPFRQQALNPMEWRNLDGTARDRIRFAMDKRGLRLELGDYFKLTWTRGTSIGGPYSSTIFQCEAIAYSPDGDVVVIEAVERDDTQTERQYLLDDETLLVRSKGALTGNADPDPGGSTCDFGGTINLTTMGVVAGDILLLRSSAEAADAFLGNAAFRITAVNSASQVAVTPAFDVAVPTGIANADWSIVRGATTYPTAVSDPTNYPDGGAMYGKVTAADGTTSDAATGNRLISG